MLSARLPRLRRFALFLFAAAALSGCSGSLPPLHNDNEGPTGLSAVLLRARFAAPSGELRTGELSLNLESDKQKYRLTAYAKRTMLYQVQPGLYRLAPTRTFFGSQDTSIHLEINGKTVDLSFPKDIAEHEPIDLKPGSVAAIGVVEVRFNRTEDPNKASVAISLDDGQGTLSWLIQDMIQQMMGPEISDTERESLMIWAQPLEKNLMEIQRNQRSESY